VLNRAGAGWLNIGLSIRLAELGRRDEALAAAEQAVRIYRPLAKRYRRTLLPGLSVPLARLSDRRWEIGRLEAAKVLGRPPEHSSTPPPLSH
jgi:hypothetical protein